MKRADYIVIAIAVTAVCITAGFFWLIFSPPEPPYHYAAAEFPAERAVYAPGEILVFTPTLIIRDGGEIAGLRSYWDVTRGRPARTCAGGPTPKYTIENNFPPGVYGNILTGAPTVPLPIPNMPPGEYQLLTNVHGFGRQAGQVSFMVRFKIVQAC